MPVEWIDDSGYPAGRLPSYWISDEAQAAAAGADAAARDVVRAAFVSEFGREPSLSERQGAQLIGKGETSYGRGWSDSPERCPNGNCSGSHNWGAIIIRPCPPCPNGGALPACPDGFISKDTCPDGSPCYQCFRAYPDDVAGAAHLVRILYGRRPSVLAAATRGDLKGMIEAMSETGYFTASVPTYLSLMRNHYDRMVGALGEPKALENGSGALQAKQTKASKAAWIVGGALAGAAAVVTYPYWKDLVQ